MISLSKSSTCLESLLDLARKDQEKRCYLTGDYKKLRKIMTKNKSLAKIKDTHKNVNKVKNLNEIKI